MSGLVDPVTVEEDDMAGEDRMPDEPDDEELRRGERGLRNPILEAMAELGPCSAPEIAQQLGRAPANVSTRLRQMEVQGRVRRTGRSVPGGRGGPQIEWETMPADGEPTGPGTPQAMPFGKPEERLRAMAEKLGHALGRVEALEGVFEGAKARADQADRLRREAVEALNAARERISTLEADTAHRPTPAGGDDMRRRYFDLLIGMAERDDAPEHIFDRLERLIDGGGE
jgi:predicted ArsR family transcriptional regulator